MEDAGTRDKAPLDSRCADRFSVLLQDASSVFPGWRRVRRSEDNCVLGGACDEGLAGRALPAAAALWVLFSCCPEWHSLGYPCLNPSVNGVIPTNFAYRNSCYLPSSVLDTAPLYAIPFQIPGSS